MKIKISLLLIFFIMLTMTCEKKPSEPEYDNPFDNQNQDTGGDPFQLTVAMAGGGITLSWTIPQVSGLTGFKIYRSQTEQSGYILLQAVDINKNTYVDKSIENGHSYWYRISAINTQNQETVYTNTTAVHIITSPALIINGGAEYAPGRTVNLTILASTAVEMILSNSSDFSSSAWEPFDSDKEWTLSTGRGEKIVFLKVKYDNGSESSVLSDTINPLPINPGLVIAGNAPYTSTRLVKLTLNASGTDLQMKIGNDSSFTGVDWQNFLDTLTYPLPAGAGIKRVYARYKNDFEIESNVVFDDINPQPINPGIVINNNAAFAVLPDVSLSLSASGSNLQMKIAEDSTFSGIEWQAYEPLFNYRLSSGDGIKRVYAKLKNDFEMESATVLDSIILDTTPPIISLAVDPDSGITDETEFHFDPTASADNLTASQDLGIRFDWQNDGIFDTDWTSLHIVSRTFDSGGGNKTVSMQLMDAAGWQVATTITVFVNSRPVAAFTATRDGDNYRLYRFDASNSSDYEDGSDLFYRWDFNNDGSWEIDFGTEKTTDYEYANDGNYTIVLEVKDKNNALGRADLTIGVGSIPRVYIAGGTFTMGDTWGDGNSNELPTRSVTLNSFYISQYEVDQTLWQNVVGTIPSFFIGANRPVERVTWYDVIDFCNKLSLQDGLTNCYTIVDTNVTCNFYATGYRLPTEAEWEYAARGGMRSQGYKYSGSNIPDEVAWYSVNSGSQTHDAGTKNPNELNIYDLSGNVAEWCWDWYGSYNFAGQANPTGPAKGTYRIVRGGSWIDPAFTGIRTAYRGVCSPQGCDSDIGFRVVRR
jgi:formylglycine-generating enzyme required for sulfatase activity